MDTNVTRTAPRRPETRVTDTYYAHFSNTTRFPLLPPSRRGGGDTVRVSTVNNVTALRCAHACCAYRATRITDRKRSCVLAYAVHVLRNLTRTCSSTRLFHSTPRILDTEPSEKRTCSILRPDCRRTVVIYSCRRKFLTISYVRRSDRFFR